MRKLTWSPMPSFVLSFSTSIEVVRATVLVPRDWVSGELMSAGAGASGRTMDGGAADTGLGRTSSAAQQSAAKCSDEGRK